MLNVKILRLTCTLVMDLCFEVLEMFAWVLKDSSPRAGVPLQLWGAGPSKPDGGRGGGVAYKDWARPAPPPGGGGLVDKLWA